MRYGHWAGRSSGASEISVFPRAQRRPHAERPRHQRELAPGVPVGPIPPTNGRFAPESGLRGTLWEFTLSPSPARKLTAPPLAARNGAESGRAARAAADDWR